MKPTLKVHPRTNDGSAGAVTVAISATGRPRAQAIDQTGGMSSVLAWMETQTAGNGSLGFNESRLPRQGAHLPNRCDLRNDGEREESGRLQSSEGRGHNGREGRMLQEKGFWTENGNVLKIASLDTWLIGQWKPILARFSLACQGSGLPRRVKENMLNVRRFLEDMNPAGSSGITASTVEEHLGRLTSRGMGVKTILNVKGSISRFCGFLRLRPNPCREVVCARAEVVPPPTIDSSQDAPLLALAAEFGILAEVAVALYAGLRLSEVSRLAWADVDLASRTLLVRKAKGKAPRVVSICAPLLSILAGQKERTGATGFLFPSRQTWRGGWRYRSRAISPQTLWRKIVPLQDRFPQFRALPPGSVGNGWHMLRHSFATRLAQANVDIGQGADWLGHTDMRMTKRYWHLKRTYNPLIEGVTR